MDRIFPGMSSIAGMGEGDIIKLSMTQLKKRLPRHIEEEYASALRKGMLLAQRETTRERGQRILLRLVALGDPYFSPAAMCGLASSYQWSNQLKSCLDWLHKIVGLYSMTKEAVWAYTLMAHVYRMLGMRAERFDVERKRFLLMRKMAFRGECREDRIYALGELVKELESRDLRADAQRCKEELHELMALDDNASLHVGS